MRYERAYKIVNQCAEIAGTGKNISFVSYKDCKVYNIWCPTNTKINMHMFVIFSDDNNNIEFSTDNLPNLVEHLKNHF